MKFSIDISVYEEYDLAFSMLNNQLGKILESAQNMKKSVT